MEMNTCKQTNAKVDPLSYGLFQIAGRRVAGHFTEKLGMYGWKGKWNVIHLPTQCLIISVRSYREARDFLLAIKDLDWDFTWPEKARQNLPEVERRLHKLTLKME